MPNFILLSMKPNLARRDKFKLNTHYKKNMK